MTDDKHKIAELENQLAEATAIRAKVQAEIQSLRAADDSVAGARQRLDRITDLTTVLYAIDDGVVAKVGIPIDLDYVRKLENRAPPDKLRRQLKQLRAARDAAAARVDPNAIAGSFRYTGSGKHFLGAGADLRRVKHGEVVELTNAQAAAFADRFTRIEPEPEPQPTA